jgi:hypothetical protein
MSLFLQIECNAGGIFNGIWITEQIGLPGRRCTGNRRTEIIYNELPDDKL